MSTREELIQGIEAIDSAIEEIRKELAENERARAELVAELGEDPKKTSLTHAEWRTRAPGVPTLAEWQEYRQMERKADLVVREGRRDLINNLYRPEHVDLTGMPEQLQLWARQHEGQYEVHLVNNPHDYPRVLISLCKQGSTDEGEGFESWFRVQTEGADGRREVCSACLNEVERASRSH